MNKQRKRDEFYMDFAHMVSMRSKCRRMKVGAVLVKNEDIVGTGYNGPPRGYEPDVCECADTGETHEHVIHAELNAVLSAARLGRVTEGATLYVTLSPCSRCAALIMQSGIKEVVYREKYRHSDGLMLLSEYGITIRQLS